MIKATSINEVIAHFDNIIMRCKQEQSRIGYFTTLYRKMTIAVQQGIANNSFADGKRMEMLDIIFANRYLAAWDAYVNKQRCTNAWCAAFNASSNNKLIVLQHLILGINTHINLDLGIAAAEACPGNQIQDLKPDFNKINDIIAALTEGVQNDLSELWPPLKFLVGIANHHQEAVLNLSIDVARKASWTNALTLATANSSDRENHIKSMDDNVVILANRIINPGFGIDVILWPVLEMESKKVDDIIEILYT